MDLVYVLRDEQGHVDKHWHQDCLPQHLLTHSRLGQVGYLDGSYSARTQRCELCQNLVSEPRRVLKWS